MCKALLYSSALGAFGIMTSAAQAQTSPPPQMPPSGHSADVSAPQPEPAGQSAVPTTPAPSGVEEIVVTAQRRSENLQRVPISVSVATSAQLQASGVSSLQSLKLVEPSVQIANTAGQILPFIRGVGSRAVAPGVEPPIAVYVDGVYYASPITTAFSFNNIEQIEVLRGPQGTLFGRNATGGLIQVITREPSSTFSGDASVGYGSYNTLASNLYLTGGLANGVSADIAYSGTFQGTGYGTNVYNGKDVHRDYHDIGIRSKLKAEIAEHTTAHLIFDYSDQKNNLFVAGVKAGTTLPRGFGPVFQSNYDIDQNIQPIIKNRTGGVSLRLDHDFGTVKLASITAYRKIESNPIYDGDYTATNGVTLNPKETDHQLSQELQVLSNSRGPIQWVLGAYYFDADARFSPLTYLYAGPSVAITPSGAQTERQLRTGQGTNSIAGYGQATATLTSRLRLTGGLRYTNERRTLTGPVTSFFSNGGSTTTNYDEAARFKKLTFRAAVDYDLSSNLLAYASFNRGFKSGGFNASAVTLGAFKPEQLDALEAGLKSTLLDKKLRLNVAIYHYNYDNLQVSEIVNGTSGIVNGGQAKMYGLDLDGEARISSELRIRFAYNYLHAKYTSFPGAPIARINPAGGFTTPAGDAAGNRTALSPRNTANISPTWSVPLGSRKLTLTETTYYSGRYYFEPDNFIVQGKYVSVAASVKLDLNDRLSVTGWVNNLTDHHVLQLGNITAGVYRFAYEPPRTFGFTLDGKF